MSTNMDSIVDGQSAKGIEEEDPTIDREVDELIVSATSEQQPTLSVVMPTLNEEEGIQTCIERIKDAVSELGIPTEIIVSDSSTDRTPEIAREMGAIVVEPDKPGYGYAYRYAFERARGEFIAMGDADTTYDFSELPKLLEKLRGTDADLVMGSRFDGEIKPGAMPSLHRYVGNPALTKFLNVFYDTDVSDAHSGFRVFRKEALDQLNVQSDGMEFASEMIMVAGARGLDIEEVPITYHEREGEATLDSFRDGWRHVKFMLVNAPGYLFSVPGLLMGVAGFTLLLLGFFGGGEQWIIGSIKSQPLKIGLRSTVVGSLLTIVGYEVASKGVFATIAGDPIKQPEDPITNLIVNRLSLEQGTILGLILLIGGLCYAGYLMYVWLAIGWTELPPRTHDIIAFTLIVLGVQTIFSSFFMSSVS